MSYELFDTASKNRIGYYDTREEALRMVQWAIEGYGIEWVDPMILGELDADDLPTVVVRGRELAQLALATVEAQRAS